MKDLSRYTPEPVSQGMQYGPVLPAEDSGKAGDLWLLEEAGGDPAVYQLMALRDGLREDNIPQTGNPIHPQVFSDNLSRLNRAIEDAKTGKPEPVAPLEVSLGGLVKVRDRARVKRFPFSRVRV